MTLRAEHYSFWAQAGLDGTKQVKSVALFAEMPSGDKTGSINTIDLYDNPDPEKTGNTYPLAQNPLLGKLLTGSLPKILLPAAITDALNPPLTLYFDNNSMKDLWIVITWGKSGRIER